VTVPRQADYFHSGPREFLCWEAWRRGYGRCPYCVGLDDGDWLAICDCWYAEWWLPPAVVKDPPPPSVDPDLTRMFLPFLDT
jgi:hypothetical protein